jgi:alpha-glucuronidase
MLREYDCWMQDRIVEDRACFCLDNVYAQNAGDIAKQAAEEFRLGIKRLLGFSPAVYDLDRVEAQKDGVYLGIIKSLEKRFSLPPQSLAPQSFAEGGFVIKNLGNKVIIAGQDESGLLYGVFHFLSLLTRGKAGSSLDVREEPASPLRMINHWDNIAGHIERGYAGQSLFFFFFRIDYDRDRVRDYARLLASIGINRISFNNVNVRGAAKLLITEAYLVDLAALAAIFRPFGIRLILGINFGAPWSLGKLPTADPLDPDVAEWWKKRVDIIYEYIPDLYGFIVKADSEGEPGPFQYNRNHADGANMLAKALAPHNGTVI